MKRRKRKAPKPITSDPFNDPKLRKKYDKHMREMWANNYINDWIKSLKPGKFPKLDE